MKTKSLANRALAPFIAVLKVLPKVAKFTKVALVGTTAVTYTWLFTWQFALILIYTIGIHEYGHVRAMKMQGVPTKGFYFIPFFGGAAIMEEAPKTRWSEFIVSIMGPAFGLGSIVIAIILYFLTGEAFFAATASWAALINLFNLLPIYPLDGGRVIKAQVFSLHSRVGIAVSIIMLIGGAILAYRFSLSIVGVLAVIGFFETMGDYRKHRQKCRDYQLFIDTDTHYQNQLEEMVLEYGTTPFREEAIRNTKTRIANHKLEMTDKPVMSKKQIVGSFAVYIALGVTFVVIIGAFTHIGEAALAHYLLRD